jgi:hypothetical protein
MYNLVGFHADADNTATARLTAVFEVNFSLWKQDSSIDTQVILWCDTNLTENMFVR